MNKLSGTIEKIENEDDLTLIYIQVYDDKFTSIIIDNSEISELKPGNKVNIVFKETEVSIGKNLSGGLSIRNRMKAKVKNLLKGKILTKILLDYQGNEIVSLITTNAANELNLNIGDQVEGLVKTNEISIMKDIK